MIFNIILIIMTPTILNGFTIRYNSIVNSAINELSNEASYSILEDLLNSVTTLWQLTNALPRPVDTNLAGRAEALSNNCNTLRQSLSYYIHASSPSHALSHFKQYIGA